MSNSKKRGLLQNLHFATGPFLSAIGFAVVFIVLVVLMCLITIMSKVLGMNGKKVEQTPIAVATVPVPAAAPVGLSLENVTDREAAMIMAIVADEIKKDPRELNFISIKEVKE